MELHISLKLIEMFLFFFNEDFPSTASRKSSDQQKLAAMEHVFSDKENPLMLQF